MYANIRNIYKVCILLWITRRKLTYLRMKFAHTILSRNSVYAKTIANHAPSTIVRPTIVLLLINGDANVQTAVSGRLERLSVSQCYSNDLTGKFRLLCACSPVGNLEIFTE